MISIHAPAKGATKTIIIPVACLCNFNPRSREGSDCFATIALMSCIGFQSTLPRRERQRFHKSVSESLNFNPRSREGSDGYSPGSRALGISFQSTLPRRERRLLFRGGRERDINFNPRSREGSDVYHSAEGCKRWNFNPRSREGSDQSENLIVFQYTDFNPRSREGSDQCDTADLNNFYISIHAPAKGATVRSSNRQWNCNDFNPRSREGSDV